MKLCVCVCKVSRRLLLQMDPFLCTVCRHTENEHICELFSTAFRVTRMYVSLGWLLIWLLITLCSKKKRPLDFAEPYRGMSASVVEVGI